MHRIQLWTPTKMVGDDTNRRPRQIRMLFLTNHFSQYATAQQRYEGTTDRHRQKSKEVFSSCKTP